MTHLDTSFLVDLLREHGRGKRGTATAYLDTLAASEPLVISVHVVCELLAGAELSRDPEREAREVAALCQGLDVAYPDERFAAVYASALAAVRRAGATVAAMDLLIATAAIADDAPLVTSNVKDFSRIPGLEIRSYGTTRRP